MTNKTRVIERMRGPDHASYLTRMNDCYAPSRSSILRANDVAKTPKSRRNASQNARDRVAPPVTLAKEPWG